MRLSTYQTSCGHGFKYCWWETPLFEFCVVDSNLSHSSYLSSYTGNFSFNALWSQILDYLVLLVNISSVSLRWILWLLKNYKPTTHRFPLFISQGKWSIVFCVLISFYSLHSYYEYWSNVIVSATWLLLALNLLTYWWHWRLTFVCDFYNRF